MLIQIAKLAFPVVLVRSLSPAHVPPSDRTISYIDRDKLRKKNPSTKALPLASSLLQFSIRLYPAGAEREAYVGRRMTATDSH